MGEAESGLESEGHMGGCERKGSRSASRSRGSRLARGVLWSSRAWGRSVCGHIRVGGPGSQQEGSMDKGGSRGDCFARHATVLLGFSRLRPGGEKWFSLGR